MTTLKPGRELDAAVGKYDEDGNCSAVLAAKEVK